MTADFNITVRKHRRSFPDRAIPNPIRTLEELLRSSHLGDRDFQGQEVAIPVGSRGIDLLPEIVAAMVRFLKNHNAQPVIIPSMGSHGGATAKGQAHILESLGVTEQSVGAPFRSSMETVQLGAVQAGGQSWNVYTDKGAFQIGTVLLLNRIKPHTDFTSRHESGLVKMLVIGMGKDDGARVAHSRGTLGLRVALPVMATFLLENLNILGGVALIEDGNHHLARIDVLRPDNIVEEEPRLLELARSWMPLLPISSADLVIIEWMGKEISGTGIDTNVVGRRSIRGEPDPKTPNIGLIGVSDLTAASDGNALGVGIADMITEALAAKIDRATTARNVIATTFLERGKTPAVFPNAREMVRAALNLLSSRTEREPSVLFIHSTLHLGSFYSSHSLENELNDDPSITPEGDYHEVNYKPDGSLALQW